MKLSVLFIVVALALACVTVSARPVRKAVPAHEPAKHDFHPSTHNADFFHHPDAATAAKWAAITKQLEARNYSRPVHDIPHGHGKQLQGSNGVNGVDISAFCGKSTWSCLKKSGYTVASVRNYQETCHVDPNGVHSVANAWAAGLSHVDIYLFPAAMCGTSAAAQVDAAINSMGKVPFGTLWFDIETGDWYANHQSNVNWLTAAVNHARSRLGSNRIGIYSSVYMWGQVMNGHTGFQSLPMWYAHYDNVKSFSDWKPFGGWSRPAMK